MVLFAPRRMRQLKEEGIQEGLDKGIPIGREEGIQVGREEGIRETNAKWVAWLKRRDEAQANNQPFDEPPPSES